MSQKIRTILASLVLAAAVCAVYLCTAGYGLVLCDDYEYMEFVRVNGVSFTNLSAAIWMPLTWASYAVDGAVAAAAGVSRDSVMHVHSAGLHALACVVLFLFLRRLAPGRGMWLAFLAAAVWALHPLRVESVVWIASRKDVVSGLLLMLALYGWVRFRQARDGAGGRWYGFAVAAFALSGMAKPSVMTYPCMVALLDLLVLKSVSLKAVLNREWKPLVPYLLPGVIALAIAVLGTYAQNAGGAMDGQVVLPLWWRLVNSATALGLYVLHTVWPTSLAPQCMIRWPELPREWLVGVGVTLAAVAFGTWRTRRFLRDPERTDLVLCGALWFVLVLVPMLGLVGFGKHAFADRFTYLPAVGVSIALLALPRKGAFALLPLVAALAAVTVRQCGFWRDDGCLWARTVEIDGEGNFDAMANLGVYHYEHTHDLERAVDFFDRARKRGGEKVDRVTLHHLLALCELGRREEARYVYHDLSAYDARRIREICRSTGAQPDATTDFLVGKAIYLSGTGDRDLKREAEKTLDILLRYNGADINVRYAAYLMGRGKKEDIRSDREDVAIRYRFLR